MDTNYITKNGIDYSQYELGETIATVKHKNIVWGADISPDGKYGASVDNDGEIYVWDTKTGEIKTRISEHTKRLRAVSFANKRKWIVTVGWGEEIKVWNYLTGEFIRNIKAHDGRIWSAYFSRDDNYILTSSTDKTARIHEIKTGKLKKEYYYGEELRDAVFSPHEDFIGMCGVGGTVAIAEIDSEKVDRKYQLHVSRVNSMRFMDNGTKIVTVSDDGSIKMSDVYSGDTLKTFGNYTETVYSVDVSPDNRYIVSGGYDKRARVWDIETGEEVVEYNETNGENVLVVRFGDGGRLVVVGGRNKEAKTFSMGGLVEHRTPVKFLLQKENMIYTPIEGGLKPILDLDKEELTEDFFEEHGELDVSLFSSYVVGGDKVKILSLSNKSYTPAIDILGKKNLPMTLGSMRDKSEILIMADNIEDNKTIASHIKGRKSLFEVIAGKGQKSKVLVMADEIENDETIASHIKGKKDLRNISPNPEESLVHILQDIEKESVPKAEVVGYNSPQLILANDDIKMEKVAKVNSLTLKANDELEKVRVIFSLDSGETWLSRKIYEDSYRNIEVDIEDLDNIKDKGLTIEDFNSIGVDWTEDLIKSGKIRFGYYLEIDNHYDLSEIDQLTINIDMYGHWEVQKGGKDYKNRYTNEELTIFLYKDGVYKINYTE